MRLRLQVIVAGVLLTARCLLYGLLSNAGVKRFAVISFALALQDCFHIIGVTPASVYRGILCIVRCAEFAVNAFTFADDCSWDAVKRAVLVAWIAL